jgi:hypothetical protein
MVDEARRDAWAEGAGAEAALALEAKRQGAKAA